MNRAERRRQDKMSVKSEKRYNLTEADIDRIKNDVTNKACEVVVNNVMLAVALALHDVEGYGKTRTLRVLNHVDNTMDSINEGYISFDELHKIVAEELNIDIKSH